VKFSQVTYANNANLKHNNLLIVQRYTMSWAMYGEL